MIDSLIKAQIVLFCKTEKTNQEVRDKFKGLMIKNEILEFLSSGWHNGVFDGVKGKGGVFISFEHSITIAQQVVQNDKNMNLIQKLDLELKGLQIESTTRAIKYFKRRGWWYFGFTVGGIALKYFAEYLCTLI
jgi:hypothetical protein